MSEENTQPVVTEPNAPAQPGAAAPIARNEDDEYEAALREFDTEVRPSSTAQPAPAAPAAVDMQVATAEVLAARDEIRNAKFKQDMKSTITKVRGDLPEELFDDQIIQAWIDTEANRNPLLAEAWKLRDDNPKKFEQVVAALGKKFSKYGKLPDRQATEDREAVTAAVRGASTQAPQGKAPDFSRMTDAEFAAEKERAFGR